jgi:hypothetical protein
MYTRLRRPAVALIATTLTASVLGIVPAAYAVPLDTVSGVVTTGGTDPVEGVLAVAWVQQGEDWVEEAEDFTDETGAYLIEALPEADYRITFESPDGTYVYEAYDDVTDFDLATPVTVGGGVPHDAIDADLALAGQIAGTVTDESLEPLLAAGVSVYAETAVSGGGSDWTYVDGTETDEFGAYEVDRLPAGTYRVEFDADGYQSEYFDDVPTLEGSEPVEVVGGEPTGGISAALAEDATISGTVTGADDQPLSHAFVYVSPVGSDDWEYAVTDDNGHYTVGELPTGSYTVYFDYDVDYDTTGEYLYEYYDNVGEIEDATPLTVAAGDDEVGIDAQLVAGEHEPVMLPYVDNQSAPVVSGVAQVGATLTATAGTWAPTPTRVEYYWFRNGDWIESANSATYVPTAADLGKQLTVLVGVSADGYERTYAESAPTAAVVAAPVPPAPTPVPPAPVVDVPTALAKALAAVTVTGKPKVGKTVKVVHLDLDVRTAVTYKFQWYAGAAKIKKATKSKLKVLSSMRGKKLSVKVTATAASTSKSVKIKVGKVR